MRGISQSADVCTPSLRAAILAALADTSSRQPLRRADLCTRLTKFEDDPDAVHAELDRLFNDRIINRVAGMKEGVAYISYWLTGATSHTPPSLSITKPAHQPPYRIAAPQQTIPATAKAGEPEKVQPKTAKPMQKTASPVQKPTTPQEETMSKDSRSMTAIIVEAVTKQPGITRDAIIAAVQKEKPGLKPKHIVDILNYTAGQTGKIHGQGRGDGRTFHPGPAAGKTAAKAKPTPTKTKTQLAKKAAAPQPAAAAPKAATAKPACAVEDPPAHAPTGCFSFAIAQQPDGTLSISKNGQTVELSALETQLILAHATLKEAA